MNRLLWKAKSSLLVVIFSSQLLVAQHHSLFRFLISPDSTRIESVSWYGSFESRSLFSFQQPINNWILNAGISFGKKQHLLLLGYN